MNNRDRVALVIAAGLVAWGIVSLTIIAVNGRPLSEVGGQALLAIGGGLVASLAAYFASAPKKNGNNGDK
jgi:hypothetical protein